MRFNIIPVVLASVFALVALLMLGATLEAVRNALQPNTYELVYTDNLGAEWIVDYDLSRDDCSRALGEFVRHWPVEDFKELACEESSNG